MPCSWIGELDIVKIEILKKEKKKRFQFSANWSINTEQISSRLFLFLVGSDKLILKFTCKHKEPRKPTGIVQKNQAGELTSSGFKMTKI